ncbi:hypothetical protein CONPUDRAFT_159758 [Coniophora puteana RWD-64-598 SS2]|uniref:Uncharacterized protein n=1 Tax=Coniophora puteana (strain RWD-64-598) TaxID=741705 RepID=A0A5M3M6M9_CONPW|nr:uncharacterized protein CONPUDRAFT_159758 [Coniophora puteana RWD-64-598 SS2]EIW74998.1 hypothetical protein CONPUDRAFT_159758 [Coniophora puteana RWD-64-598 SS2]
MSERDVNAGGPSDSNVIAQALGGPLIGTFVNTYLYGLVTFQFLKYTRAKFRDPFSLRLTVAMLFVLDTAHSISGVYIVYDICVVDYANPSSIGGPPWTYPFTMLASAVETFLTQAFLIYRISASGDSVKTSYWQEHAPSLRW